VRSGLAFALAVVCAAGAVGLAGAATRRPYLRITDRAPLTVRGSGFLAREYITVTAVADVRRRRRLFADARGRFIVAFRGVSVKDECLSYRVRAVGGRGTWVSLTVTATCTSEDVP
jgi:hypothetical protein